MCFGCQLFLREIRITKYILYRFQNFYGTQNSGSSCTNICFAKITLLTNPDTLHDFVRMMLNLVEEWHSWRGTLELGDDESNQESLTSTGHVQPEKNDTTPQGVTMFYRVVMPIRSVQAVEHSSNTVQSVRFNDASSTLAKQAIVENTSIPGKTSILRQDARTAIKHR